ncbi:hypothetical protein L7F22_068429 [Adiantum nelumboides]|nr:hypothetical protein [Adiantum nelumboides]
MACSYAFLALILLLKFNEGVAYLRHDAFIGYSEVTTDWPPPPPPPPVQAREYLIFITAYGVHLQKFDDDRKDAFVFGLDEYTKFDVQIADPVDFNAAVRVALKQKMKHNKRKPKESRSSTSTPSSNQSQQNGKTNGKNGNNSSSSSQLSLLLKHNSHNLTMKMERLELRTLLS